jgi:hypothetical protein
MFYSDMPRCSLYAPPWGVRQCWWKAAWRRASELMKRQCVSAAVSGLE